MKVLNIVQIKIILVAHPYIKLIIAVPKMDLSIDITFGLSDWNLFGSLGQLLRIWLITFVDIFGLLDKVGILILPPGWLKGFVPVS